MDHQISSTWRFERDVSLPGFFSTRQVSTDAINALSAWQALDGRRGFEVIAGEHAPDFLDARLSTTKDDADAGPELDGLAQRSGVVRRPL